MQFRELEVARLRPSPLNPRKHFDEGKLQELAASFAGAGIIEPLVVRPINPGEDFEIVAGARRYRAAQLAQLETVPVIVRQLTDTQVLEIMVIENNQREDVNPLEEGDGFARLLKTGYDLDKLAERLGRSKKYVYDRMKLLDLVPPAKQLLLDGKLTAGHGILLARLKPEDQARAIDIEDGGAFSGDAAATEAEEEARQEFADRAEAYATRRGAKQADELLAKAYAAVKPRSVRELDRWIANHVRFDVSQAAQAAPLEYGEVAQRVEQAAAKPGRGKKVIAITFEHYIQPDARDGSERTYGPQSWKFADGQQHPVDRWSGKVTVFPTCEYSVLGVVAAGEKYGKAFDVCVARDKCQVHWKQEIAARQKNQKLRESGQAAKADKNEAARRAKEEAQRKEREAAEKRRDLVEARAMHQALESVKEVTPDLVRAAIAIIAGGDMDTVGFAKRFGVKGMRYGSCELSMFKSLSGRTLAQALAFCVVSAEAAYGDVARMLSFLGVDLKKVEAAVIAEEKAAALKQPDRLVVDVATLERFANACQAGVGDHGRVTPLEHGGVLYAVTHATWEGGRALKAGARRLYRREDWPFPNDRIQTVEQLAKSKATGPMRLNGLIVHASGKQYVLGTKDIRVQTSAQKKPAANPKAKGKKR